MRSCRSAFALGVSAVLLAMLPFAAEAQGLKDLARGSYAQLSSIVDQVAANTGPNVVAMESTDAASGVKNENGRVTIAEEGTYFVIAAAQVGGLDGGSVTGSVKLWVRLNGQDVPNTNTEQYIQSPEFTAVQVCQGVYYLKSGDVLEVVYSATKPGLGMIVRKPENEPFIPSIIFSIFKID